MRRGGHRPWQPVTAQDLRAFGKETVALALRATEDGWLGRLSSKGHLIMRAPDGRATMSLGREEGKRALRNNLADYRRWQRSRG